MANGKEQMANVKQFEFEKRKAWLNKKVKYKKRPQVGQ
jgi:hypothetical protein